MTVVSEAALPLVNILDYRIRRLLVRPLATFAPAVPIECQVQTRFRIGTLQSEPRRFILRVSFRVHGGRQRTERSNTPYDITVAIDATFESPINVSASAVPAPLVTNALSILYGVARGVIGQTTGASENGLFVLPAMTFDPIVYEAAKAPNSSIILPTDRPGSNEESAHAYYRFIFALEDLPLAIAGLPQQFRDRAEQFAMQFFDGLNALPNAAHAQEPYEKAIAGLEGLTNILVESAADMPSRPILQRILDALSAGLKHLLAAKIAQLQSTAAAEPTPDKA